MSGKYKIGKIRKLVDLNKNLINFNLDFVIHSEDKSSTFEIAVVTQDTLDNNYPIKYQKAANGYISGNVKSDNNTYNNYLIVIKAEEDMDVSIDLTIHEIMGAQQQQLPKQEVKHEEQPDKKTQENFDILYTSNSFLFTKRNLLIFFIIVILVSCIYIYHYYTNNNTAPESLGSKSTPESGGNAPDKVKEIISPPPLPQEIINSEKLRYPNQSRLFESI
jgi:hypothetical protein